MLCTRTRSFAVKHVETSNTLLLISPDVEVGMPEAQQHCNEAMAFLTGGHAALQAAFTPLRQQGEAWCRRLRGGYANVPLPVAFEVHCWQQSAP